MKIKFVVFLILAQSCLNAQEISFDKDSLYFIPTAENYGYADTLWMYNHGSEELVVDSAVSTIGFGYKLESIYSDSIVLFDYIYDNGISMNLPAQDSMMLIIANPDRCPFCKLYPRSDIYNDTIIFINNSDNNPQYKIFTFISEYLSIEVDKNLTLNIELLQNYPNPFNPTTTIEFYLAKPEYVSLEIFNSLGERVIYLISEKMSAGVHQVSFNGNKFSSGIYLYRLTAGNFTETRKMFLIK